VLYFSVEYQRKTGGNQNSEADFCAEAKARDGVRPDPQCHEPDATSSGISFRSKIRCPRLIRIAVPPVPVIPLLFMAGVRAFEIVPVIVRQVHSPRVTLVVIPVVIIVVARVIDACLNARFLRHRRGHH
jgi:hypothetical protein